MKIREASSEDDAAIVALLKRSLGESLLPKSQEIWEYKHRANPFGRSKILVAEVDDRIVGVRAFMQWKWQLGQQVFNAFRAVDTATDPEYQGRGIFKKLTLRCLEDLAEVPNSFVFNTPNDQSRPGYLKMGWKAVSRIPVKVGLLLPWQGHRIAHDAVRADDSETFCKHFNKNRADAEVLFTPRSVEYLRWRYKNNPLQEYVIGEGDGWFVALYRKLRKRLPECRVAESLVDSTRGDAALAAKRFVYQKARELGCLIVTGGKSDCFRGVHLKLGPTLTVRPISLHGQLAFTHDIGQWDFQLGELELF